LSLRTGFGGWGGLSHRLLGFGLRLGLDWNDTLFGKGCFEFANDRRLNGRRRSLDELANFLQLVQGAF
jgi:hypothetical protein